MEKIDATMLKYYVRYADEIELTTRPVREYFNLVAFIYLKIRNDGNVITLADCPELAADAYAKKPVTRDNPFMKHPDSYESGVVFRDPFIKSYLGSKLLFFDQKFYDTDNYVTLIEKGADGVEMAFFWGNVENNCLNTLLVENEALLKLYLAHYKASLKHIIESQEEEDLNLARYEPEHFFNANVSLTHFASDEALQLSLALG